MVILVHDPPSYAPEPSICDDPDQSVFERLVKSYYHAKFWAFSSKIERVMLNLTKWLMNDDEGKVDLHHL